MSERGSDPQRCAVAVRLAYNTMDAWLDGRPLGSDVLAEIERYDLPWTTELSRFPRLYGAQARAPHGARVTAVTRVLDSLPRAGSAEDAVTEGLNRLMRAASRTILIETPYVVLTQDAAAVLEAAGHRGVEMTLFTNSAVSTDNVFSQIYFQEQWPRLLAKVPRLRLFVSGTSHNIHSKFAIFDGQAVLLGSYNLDPFSMLVSGEIMVAVWSRPFADQVAARTRALIAAGPPQAYEYAIARDASGTPVRASTGEPVVDYGPGDHLAVAQWPRLGYRWALLHAIPWLSGLPPLF
jgi:phosphatidylserine/phosphatidylglycerophosphate/cardiolipin synthase-like enzyme